jgi:hypothetical protein
MGGLNGKNKSAFVVIAIFGVIKVVEVVLEKGKRRVLTPSYLGNYSQERD